MIGISLVNTGSAYTFNPPLTPPERGLFIFPSWEGLGVGKISVNCEFTE